MQKTQKHSWSPFFAKRTNTTSSALTLFVLLLLGAGIAPVQAQAPNVTYSGPLVITQGGTYTGNYRSNTSGVPAITIQTSQPVILENCIIASAGDLIDGKPAQADLTIRNCKGYGLTPSADNTRRGYFVAVNGARNLRVENNYFEQCMGINVHTWVGNGTPSQTLTIRYNKVKNIDSRYRNSGNTYTNFVGMDKVANLANQEIAWNEVINEPNNSLVEDNINFYDSGGTAQSAVKVHDNYIQGAYPFPATAPDFFGTGMIIDGTDINTQGYVEVYNNQIVSACNSAMNIAAGHDIYYHNNRLVTAAVLPDGTRLPSAYAGIAIFNSSQAPAFGNIRVDNNTIGYVHFGRSNPYQDRQDEGDYGLQIVTNTQHLPNPVTRATEQQEYTLWQQKLQQNGVSLGAGGTATSTPPPAPAPAPATPPTVSLSAPGTGTVGTALALTASAASASGSVAKVEFFNGGTKLGEDLTAPYALSFAPTAAGTLALTARATDNAGAATTSNTASVAVTAAAPTTPNPGTTVPSTPVPSTPGSTPANASFFRGLNVGGSATTVDGRNWEASNGAANFQINGTAFANQDVTLNPATDAARASMIRSSVYSRNLTAAVTNVVNGSYSVYLYVWEDNYAQTYSITLEGRTVQSNYNSGAAGHWDRLGPFTAAVTDGTINIGTTGGDANLSGIEIWKQSGTAVATPPTVSLSAPGTGRVGTALALTASAASASGSVAKVEFFNGGTKLGEDLTAPYALSFAPTAAGTLALTARATDNAGAATTSNTANVTVTTSTTTPNTNAPTFLRGINLGGPAITLDGYSWGSSTGAASFQATGVVSFSNQNVTLNPATSATRASMIRSSLYGSQVGLAISNVTSGTYSVYLYVWEDNNAETFNITLEGRTVQSNYNSGAAGHWDRLGPFTAAITDGTINVGTTGGTANLSGIEIWKVPSSTL